MTGFDIYESAILKLGYNNERGRIDRDAPLKAIAIEAINDLGYELCKIKPIKNLSEEIAVDEKAKSALSYGVAMLLSVYEGDSEKNALITAIFNARRAAYLSEIKQIVDVSPKIYEV